MIADRGAPDPQSKAGETDARRQGIRIPPELREELDEARNQAGHFQNRCNRETSFSFSKRLDRLRWRIETAFNRLKKANSRRIATRYDRLALKSPGLRPPRARTRTGWIL